MYVVELKIFIAYLLLYVLPFLPYLRLYLLYLLHLSLIHINQTWITQGWTRSFVRGGVEQDWPTTGVERSFCAPGRHKFSAVLSWIFIFLRLECNTQFFFANLQTFLGKMKTSSYYEHLAILKLNRPWSEIAWRTAYYCPASRIAIQIFVVAVALQARNMMLANPAVHGSGAKGGPFWHKVQIKTWNPVSTKTLPKNHAFFRLFPKNLCHVVVWSVDPKARFSV